MVSSFQSIVENIDKHIQSLEWKTDTGHTLHGVLHTTDNRVVLNVNSRELKTTVDFNYIYHESSIGRKRVLYPFDFPGSKSISATSLSNSWPVEIAVLVDEQKIPEVVNDTEVSYFYDTFLWHKVPENEAEESEYDTLMDKLRKIKTSIGEVTISLNRSESLSMHPSKIEKTMDKIVITIEGKEVFSDKELIMWHVRFSQLLALIHRERVVLKALHRGLDNILVPHLLDEDYKEGNYAFREPIGLEDFVDVINEALPRFVDNYDDVAKLIEDLTEYYRDYPLDPPDNIQLLRLFSGLEQCANHFVANNPQPKRVLSAKEKARDKEFDGLLKVIKSDSSISLDLKNYLKNSSKKYYVSPENPASTKNKIIALAEFIVNDVGVFSYLRNTDNVDTIWKMRNTVAHGFYDGDIREKFYQRRDDFGQDIEQSIRIYALHILGVNNDLIMKHKEPLKARRFNGL